MSREVLVNWLQVSQASFFKIHASNFPIHEEKETGSLRLKGRVVGSKVNRKVKASEIYIYIWREGGYNGPEGRGGWLNDRETMTKFLVDCVPLWATCLRVYDSNVFCYEIIGAWSTVKSINFAIAKQM